MTVVRDPDIDHPPTRRLRKITEIRQLDAPSPLREFLLNIVISHEHEACYTYGDSPGTYNQHWYCNGCHTMIDDNDEWCETVLDLLVTLDKIAGR